MTNTHGIVATLSLAFLSVGLATGCPGDPEEPAGDAGDTAEIADGGDTDAGVHRFSWDFAEGAQMWEASFTDYSENMENQIDFEAGIVSLPEELQKDGDGYLLGGQNVSDDLFMFLKRSVGGLAPETQYRLEWRILFASNAPSNCAGIGGAPGESVYLKAGGTPVEPQRIRSQEHTQDFVLNVDKSNQSSGGEAASVVGHVANGIPCEDADGEYVRLVKEHTHSTPVTSDEDGNLWLLVGTDSGFEGRTELYYMALEVTLRPVE